MSAASDTSSRAFAGLFVAVLKKRLTLLFRYPVNTLSEFGTIVVVFMLIFYGGRAVAPTVISDSLEGIIVGYLLWSISLTAFSGLSWNVTREAQWGTLEQLFMSPFGFDRVMFAKTTVNLIESFLWGGATLTVMLLVTGRPLSVDPLTVVPLLVLAVCPVVGMGFVFGGFAIRFKRVENAFTLVQFLFLGLIAAPVGRYPLLKWLPLVQGSRLLQRTMKNDLALWDLPAAELGALVITAVGYLIIGYVVFTICQRRARHEGVMGHY